ncbi:alpha/beta fold hydrolase [Leptospira bandrabouensis]|uniref:YheT family hydrolase n=1 Tax=Leptospira TaxID=171 RepID=UPI000C2A25BA|nr:MULTISPECIES: alpha/beta fold hydrolase [Leptospira]MCW7459834.1 alpha/beta fold hydrolase [Leptospira bandrabouensis]MCW7479254.1 alpha/beta fold hydrolase [Leptospira bandrabouensis]MCW7486950.1 alpha/beta fold hydrolase [Leptospira bandrabouensis]PJZ89832.1 hydrolase [Leptospira levettii]
MSLFKPLPIFSGPLVQSFLASFKSKSDKRYAHSIAGEWRSVKAKDGTTLLARIHEVTEPKGLVILIHGWEGSIHSSYIVRTTRFFLKKGFSVYRLNLRDHGDTHHLNEGIFNGSLLLETYEAVQALVKNFWSKGPVYLAGFSLGGNFVLRMAARHSLSKPADQIPGLKHCFAFSPALDPKSATIKMDEHPFLRKYFLNSWKSSLIKKANLFPHLYSFHDLDDYHSVMHLTAKMVKDSSQFSSVDEYFNSYTLNDLFFKSVKIPTTILTSMDDPVIPWKEFAEIPPSSYLEVVIESKGGHCGFIEDLNRSSYYWKLMEKKMG